jgi:peptide methionine sulfoxide reductase MsrB
MYEMSHSGHFFSDDPWDTGTSRRENVALELQLTAPGEWTLKRDNAELGKVQCTAQTALFALIDPKNAVRERKRRVD